MAFDRIAPDEWKKVTKDLENCMVNEMESFLSSYTKDRLLEHGRTRYVSDEEAELSRLLYKISRAIYEFEKRACELMEKMK